jgi:cytoskeletal protein CcmA (bactofilin family)
MRRRALAVVLAAVLVLAVLPGTASAATRTGGTVLVDSGETVEGDLTAYAGTVIVRGTVQGDLTAYAGTVFVDGEVTGGVEVFGGTLRVTGSVGGDAQTFGGTVFLEDGATIGGSLDAGAGTVVLDGSVGSDVRADAGSVTLGPTASVGGDLLYSGTLDRADGAAVEGSVERREAVSVGGGGSGMPSLPGYLFDTYWLLATMAAGAVLLLAFPGVDRSVVDRVTRDPLRTGGYGALALVGAPAALLVAMLTVVGIPLAVLGLLLYLLVLWVGSIYGRVAVGAWLLAQVDVENRWAALVVGMVAVALVVRVLALLPFVDFLFSTAVGVLGLGALATLAYERRTAAA